MIPCPHPLSDFIIRTIFPSTGCPCALLTDFQGLIIVGLNEGCSFRQGRAGWGLGRGEEGREARGSALIKPFDQAK